VHVLSADDLHINLWRLEVHQRCFNMADIKPSNMEELSEVCYFGLEMCYCCCLVSRLFWMSDDLHTNDSFNDFCFAFVAAEPRCNMHPQVITCADFHPSHCSLFAYSSSKGSIRLGDLRSAALCDRSAKTFQETEPEVNQHRNTVAASTSQFICLMSCLQAVHCFFSEIIAYTSSRRFTSQYFYPCQRHTTVFLAALNPRHALFSYLSSVSQAGRSFISEIIASTSSLRFNLPTLLAVPPAWN
jgi:WD40 repeat protein